ncbi:hypothetical protein RSA3_03355 [Microbacterium testaceum]|uniref:Uncharacterized protein n=2 Tax=Microbacterium testaceum TaxID=2033 RepID=A0A147FB67_MICTE|nr:hypothetical protein RSA3_03355 [Microbacterium testaceum]
MKRGKKKFAATGMEHVYCLMCEEPDRIDWTTRTGVSWRNRAGDEVEPVDDEADEDTRVRALRAGRRPVCAAAGHPLPDPDSVLVGYFGQVSAGKDSMIGSAVYAASSGALMPHGVRLAPAELSDGRRWVQVTANWVREGRWEHRPTSRKESGSYKPTELRAQVDGSDSRLGRSVMLFNTSGEDYWGEPPSADSMLETGPERSFHATFPFLPELDVIVIAVPPGALEGHGLRQRVGDSSHSPDRTISGIEKIATVVREIDSVRAWPEERARRRIVVLALTKCDRYARVEGFPERVLRPRDRDRSLRDQMAEEQALLGRFLVTYGGTGILHAATGVADTVYFSAVSGTGPDDPGRSVIAAAPHLADAKRSLDPLHLAFMRHSIGRYA